MKNEILRGMKNEILRIENEIAPLLKKNWRKNIKLFFCGFDNKPFLCILKNLVNAG
jgi:hypothetical protein